MMRIAKAAMAIATVAAAGAISTPSASADNYPVVEKFGTQEKLVDGAGAVEQGWTVAYLQPSTDTVPWNVRGSLWESSATVQAIRGTVTPIISDLNARAANGQSYQALAVPTARGINPSTLPQGGQATGKIYFDVVGPTPDGVVYNAGGRDLLFWVR
jgi:Domain of unknown function (DUF1942)